MCFLERASCLFGGLAGAFCVCMLRTSCVQRGRLQRRRFLRARVCCVRKSVQRARPGVSIVRASPRKVLARAAQIACIFCFPRALPPTAAVLPRAHSPLPARLSLYLEERHAGVLLERQQHGEREHGGAPV